MPPFAEFTDTDLNKKSINDHRTPSNRMRGANEKYECYCHLYNIFASECNYQTDVGGSIGKIFNRNSGQKNINP
jgi:hypothetical protein